MTCESIFRDISDIHSRLFNHRAALQGLESNFVREFEDKRGDKETISLSINLEEISDCKDRALPFVLDNIGPYLKDLKAEAEKTTGECNRILKDSDDKKTDWLESQNKRRQEEWQSFMTAQVSRSARVDDDFEKRVSALQKHYTELEEKLRGSGKAVL